MLSLLFVDAEIPNNLISSLRKCTLGQFDTQLLGTLHAPARFPGNTLAQTYLLLTIQTGDHAGQGELAICHSSIGSDWQIAACTETAHKPAFSAGRSLGQA